jgi:hypothetical protein
MGMAEPEIGVEPVIPEDVEVPVDILPEDMEPPIDVEPPVEPEQPSEQCRRPNHYCMSEEKYRNCGGQAESVDADPVCARVREGWDVECRRGGQKLACKDRFNYNKCATRMGITTPMSEACAGVIDTSACRKCGRSIAQLVANNRTCPCAQPPVAPEPVEPGPEEGANPAAASRSRALRAVLRQQAARRAAMKR